MRTLVTYLLFVLPLTLSLPACYEAPTPACAFACGNDNACPENYSCRGDGWCKRSDVDDNFVCSTVSLVDAAGSGVDATVVDAAIVDAALVDATPLDAALVDATPLDAAIPFLDATIPDAALPDAALPDAALPDAALPDAALPDAALPDATLPDAA